MPESAGSRLASGAHQWARLALALLVIGPSILLVYAWVEVLNDPAISLADGYWIGRQPYTLIGVLASLAGGVAGVVAGSVAIAIEGGWWRRLLVVAAAMAALLWWAMAFGIVPYPEIRSSDPATFAYSLPVQAALLLLMPAALLAALCLTPRMVSAPRTRLRPVQSVAPPPRTWLEAHDDLELDAPDPADEAR